MAPLPDISQTLRFLLAAVVAEAVQPAVAAALQQALPEILRRASRPAYLTRQQVMDLTGWSERKLAYLQSQRRLPYLKRGRSVLFKTEDVEAYLAEGYVPAAPPPSERRRAGDRPPIRGTRRG